MTNPSGKYLSFRRLIPNFVTVMAIVAGLTSMRMGLDGRYEFALLLIVVAAVLDAIDGRLARMLDSASPMGAELDSLADFFNFGIAPGLLIYQAIFFGTPYASLGWLAVLVLCVCCALRLARFNVAMQDSESEGSGARPNPDYFVGVPAPALACLALLPMYFLMLEVDALAHYPIAIFLYLVLVGGLAVSQLPTFSVKRLRVEKKFLLPVVLLVTGAIVMMAAYPWHTLIAGDLLYLASLPVSARRRWRELEGG